jgi:hypothetical protein
METADYTGLSGRYDERLLACAAHREFMLQVVEVEVQ